MHCTLDRDRGRRHRPQSENQSPTLTGAPLPCYMSQFVPRTDRQPSAMHLLASYFPYEISAGQDGG